MLKKYWDSLGVTQKEHFLKAAGISSGVMNSKYLRLAPSNRAKPRGCAFERLLNAIQLIPSPSNVQLTRADLAVYFYAAPDQTGQGESDAA